GLGLGRALAAAAGPEPCQAPFGSAVDVRVVGGGPRVAAVGLLVAIIDRAFRGRGFARAGLQCRISSRSGRGRQGSVRSPDASKERRTRSDSVRPTTVSA